MLKLQPFIVWGAPHDPVSNPVLGYVQKSSVLPATLKRALSSHTMVRVIRARAQNTVLRAAVRKLVLREVKVQARFTDEPLVITGQRMLDTPSLNPAVVATLRRPIYLGIVLRGDELPVYNKALPIINCHTYDVV